MSDAALPCTAVTSVSTPISAPGRYCLVRDIVSWNGYGIVIKANNVTLDFAGHKLSTPVRTTPTGRQRVGVDASTSHTVTIRNGTVQGFNHGIILGELVTTPNPGNYVVTNMKILDTASIGRSVGIFAIGQLGGHPREHQPDQCVHPRFEHRRLHHRNGAGGRVCPLLSIQHDIRSHDSVRHLRNADSLVDREHTGRAIASRPIDRAAVSVTAVRSRIVFIVENRAALGLEIVVLARIDGPEHRPDGEREHAESQEHE